MKELQHSHFSQEKSWSSEFQCKRNKMNITQLEGKRKQKSFILDQEATAEISPGLPSIEIIQFLPTHNHPWVATSFFSSLTCCCAMQHMVGPTAFSAHWVVLLWTHEEIVSSFARFMDVSKSKAQKMQINRSVTKLTGISKQPLPTNAFTAPYGWWRLTTLTPLPLL